MTSVILPEELRCFYESLRRFGLNKNNVMEMANESLELGEDSNQSQPNAPQAEVGNRKGRTTKPHTRVKRAIVSRKRNRDGQLTSVVNFESVGTSELASHESNIEIIDVEQVKDKPIVDLTDESIGDTYVDLTSSPDLPQRRQSVICWQLARPRTFTSERNKNTDEIVIVPNESKRTVNVDTEQSPPMADNIMTCAICMDDFNQIKKAKRQLTSTTCGHVFCNPCITSSIRSQAKCPTCRKRLTKRSLHPIFL